MTTLTQSGAGGGITPVQVYESMTGGGGGGGSVAVWAFESYEQTAAFSAGLTLSLAHAPADPNTVAVDYNGRTLRKGVDFSLSGATVTILFSDPDVTFYDSTPYFQIQYAY